MTHFLDETGNIAREMHKDGRNMAGFLAMVIDATTKSKEEGFVDLDIRCNVPGCTGPILAEIIPVTEEIHWGCTECENDGIISDWKNTKWDNSGASSLSD